MLRAGAKHRDHPLLVQVDRLQGHAEFEAEGRHGLDAGVRSFDASIAGVGGCPFAPGASGNVITEDLVFMLESMVVATGIDYEKLIAARQALLAAARHTLRPGVEPIGARGMRGPRGRREDSREVQSDATV